MGFLSTLLPGLRDLRTPLLVGYAYLLALWIAFSQDLATGVEWTHFQRIFLPLQQTFGSVFVVASASVVAYLVGVLLSSDTRSMSKASDLVFYYSPWRVTPRDSGPGLTKAGQGGRSQWPDEVRCLAPCPLRAWS